MPIDPMDLTVTTASSPFVLTQGSTQVFTLSGGAGATISLQLNPSLAGGVDLKGPAGDPALRALSAFVAGFPGPSEIVASGLSPYTFDLSVGESRAEARIAATAQTIFIIYVEGVAIGTITFEAGQTIGNIVYTDTTVTKGDLVTIEAPASPDASLQDATFLLA